MNSRFISAMDSQLYNIFITPEHTSLFDLHKCLQQYYLPDQ